MASGLSEIEAMEELARMMWERYIKPKTSDELLRHSLDGYKAQVTANNGDGTLTVSRPFDNTSVTLKCPPALATEAEAGDQVLVVELGDSSNAFILCGTDMSGFGDGGGGTIDVYRPISFDFSTIGSGYFTEIVKGADNTVITTVYDVVFDADGRIVSVTSRTDDWETDVDWPTYEPIPASEVGYDNTGSGMSATNVQDAIDEVDGDLGTHVGDTNNPHGVTAAQVGAYVKPSGGIPATDLASGVIPTVPGISTSTPNMDGAGAAGSTGQVSDAGHVHPVDTSRVPVYGLGKNLLDNGYFANPVNQRESTTGTTPNNQYFIDRWRMSYGTAVGTWSLVTGGLQLVPGTGGEIRLIQVPENWAEGTGKTFTLSVLTSDGKLRYGTQTKPASGAAYFFSDSGIVGNCVASDIRIQASVSCTIVAAKLDRGTEQTLCHNEGTDANPVWVLNEIPDYGEELRRCQRYFIRIAGAMLIGFGFFNDATTIRGFIPLPVTLRGNADISYNLVQATSSSGLVQLSNIYQLGDTVSNGITIEGTASANGVTNNLCVIRLAGVSGSRLDISADL